MKQMNRPHAVQAVERAIAIAQAVYGTVLDEDGNDDRTVWNRGGWPTNAPGVAWRVNADGDVVWTVPLQPVDDFAGLNGFLENSPVYAYYWDGVDGGAAHLIVVTGTASAPGHDSIVLSNNPWGVRNIQNYNDFSRMGINDNEDDDMIFRSILRP